MNIKLAIFCTGGTHLGYGHFFRSIEFFKSSPTGFDTKLFPIAEKKDVHIFDEIKEKTFISENEKDTFNKIEKFAPNILVFDTVSCSDYFWNKIEKMVSWRVSISPVFDHMEKMDFLFTRNGNTAQIGDVKIYSGFQYAIFNENCMEIPDNTYKNNLSKTHLTIGVAMGGGDAANKTLSIVQALSKLDIPCTFWVLLGEGYKHSYQQLVDCISIDRKHEIILAKTNRSMWSIFSNCSVAILAGGLTTVEALYAGLPSINIFEKQKHLQATSSTIFKNKMAINLGLFQNFSAEKLLSVLSEMNNNRNILLAMRNRSKGVLDKLGSVRIYEKLKQVYLQQ